MTILREELDAACEVFGTQENIAATAYHVRRVSNSNDYPVVVRKAVDRGNTASAEAARDVIEDFRPSFLFLVGIAGGVHDRDGTQLGDVIVADFINYSELRKMEDGKSKARHAPYDHPSIFLRERFAEPVGRQEAWIRRISCERPIPGTPEVRIGQIVAGEKLWADPKSEEQKALLEEYDKALGIEMEAWGFARAVCKARNSVHYNPMYLVIRGVSDLVNDETEDNDATRRLWRKYAAGTAAAFACELVEALAKQFPSSQAAPPSSTDFTSASGATS